MIKEPTKTCPGCDKEFLDTVGSVDIPCAYAELLPYCDLCEKGFCSEECIQLTAIEDVWPGSCPGVYCCVLCRKKHGK